MNRIPFIVLLVLVFSACSNAPTPPVIPAPLQPTKIELQIEANSKLNLDISGNSSPVMFRVYELKDTSSFNNADFFALMEKDQTVLANDLSRKHEVTLKIGESKMLSLSTEKDVKALCFFASFRKLDDADWRICNEILANRDQKIVVRVKDNKIALDKLIIEK